jgi:hypothetical protein
MLPTLRNFFAAQVRSGPTLALAYVRPARTQSRVNRRPCRWSTPGEFDPNGHFASKPVAFTCGCGGDVMERCSAHGLPAALVRGLGVPPQRGPVGSCRFPQNPAASSAWKFPRSCAIASDERSGSPHRKLIGRQAPTNNASQATDRTRSSHGDSANANARNSTECSTNKAEASGCKFLLASQLTK